MKVESQPLNGEFDQFSSLVKLSLAQHCVEKGLTPKQCSGLLSATLASLSSCKAE